MGSDHSYAQKLAQLEGHEPPLQQYGLISSEPNRYIWKNLYANQLLFQYPLILNDQQILQQHIKTYFFRHRHQFLISTLYFQTPKQKQSINKNQQKQASIFYEEASLNILNIQSLGFEDCLHFYYATLKGFQILFRKYGYFHIQESMIFMTSSNKVKVWCNSNIAKIYPDQQFGSRSIAIPQQRQKAMIQRILQIIGNKTRANENTRRKIDIGYILGGKSCQSFREVIKKLREVCRDQMWIIPERVEIVKIVFGTLHKDNQMMRGGNRTKKKSKGVNLSVNLAKNNSRSQQVISPFPQVISSNSCKSLLTQKPINRTNVSPYFKKQTPTSFQHSPSQPLISHPLPPRRMPPPSKLQKKQRIVKFINSPHHMPPPSKIISLQLPISANNRPRNISNGSQHRSRLLPGKTARSSSADQCTGNNVESRVISNYKNKDGILLVNSRVDGHEDAGISMITESYSKMIQNVSPMKMGQVRENKSGEVRKEEHESSVYNESNYNKIFDEWKKLNAKLQMHKLNINHKIGITSNSSLKPQSSNFPNLSNRTFNQQVIKSPYQFTTLQHKQHKESKRKTYTFDKIIEQGSQIKEKSPSIAQKYQFRSKFFEDYLSNLKLQKDDEPADKKYVPDIDEEILKDMNEMRNSRNR